MGALKMNENNQETTNNLSTSSLTPTSIGKLAEPKGRKTGLIIVFFFIILFGAIFYLPDIFAYFNKIDLCDLGLCTSDKTSKQDYPNNNDKLFNLETMEKIYVDGIGFYNFTISNNVLYYQVANYNENRISITELGLFVNIYDENQDILNTYSLMGGIVNSNTMIDNFTPVSNVDTSKIKYIGINKEQEIVIPDVELSIDGNGYGILTCTIYPDIYKYYFINKNLEKVDHEINISVDKSEDFNLEVERMTNKEQIYKGSQGYVSNVSLVTTDATAIFRASINLRSQYTYNLDTNYMAKDIEAKNVNFDMKTKGFDCQ